MNRKLPADAFAYYLSLGVGRSYAKVAQHFGVAKRTVVTLATTEGWQERVTEAEAKARDSAAENYVDTIREMNSKHLKVLSFMLAKGLEGLKNAPVDDFTSAVRAVTVAIDRERLVRGDPRACPPFGQCVTHGCAVFFIGFASSPFSSSASTAASSLTASSSSAIASVANSSGGGKSSASSSDSPLSHLNPSSLNSRSATSEMWKLTQLRAVAEPPSQSVKSWIDPPLPSLPLALVTGRHGGLALRKG